MTPSDTSIEPHIMQVTPVMQVTPCSVPGDVNKGAGEKMDDKVTYRQQINYCGKPRCRKCQEGIGHGPYWYAYQTTNGRTTRTYIGKSLPPEVQATMDITPSTDVTPPSGHADFSSVQLRIFTLGHFQIERRVGQQWQAVNDTTWLRRSRVRAFLALLLCSPGRAINRTMALEMLWPRKDEEAANHELNATLQSLRKILRIPRENQSQAMLLRSDGDMLVLADQQTIWLDADAFTSLADQALAPTNT